MKIAASCIARACPLAALGLVIACSPQDTAQNPTRTVADGQIAAVVNGEQISSVQVQRHATQRGSGDAPSDPAAATQELINLLLLSQEAARREMHTRPAVIEELARQRTAVLAMKTSSYLRR